MKYLYLKLPSETPRSQRPIQQEWYEDVNKSRLTHVNNNSCSFTIMNEMFHNRERIRDEI